MVDAEHDARTSAIEKFSGCRLVVRDGAVVLTNYPEQPGEEVLAVVRKCEVAVGETSK